MTLITQGDSDGERRCDARCYNAKSESCDCVWGGRNHGAGAVQAMENTKELARKILFEKSEDGEYRFPQMRDEKFRAEVFGQGTLFGGAL